MSNAPLLLNKLVSVEHLNPDSNNANKEGFVADASLAMVPVNIQAASMEVTALNNGAYGKGYTLFTTNSGILSTDRLTTVSGSDTRQYIVKGREHFDLQMAQHLEMFLEELQ
jgi:hypothetical protein